MANTLLHITSDWHYRPIINTAFITSGHSQNITAKLSICDVKPVPDLQISGRISSRMYGI